MNTTKAEGPQRWWVHLRRRPDLDGVDRRGIWPPNAGIGLRATRPAGPLDTAGLEPPTLGVLALGDEGLNRRAEALGVTERSLGWLRAWGEHACELAFELVEFVLDHGAGAALPTEATLLAGMDRLLCGRVDDEWLAAERRAADAPGDEVVTVLRLVGLCELAAGYGASAAEVGAVATAAACHDAFRRSVRAEGGEHAVPSGMAMAGERRYRLVADEVKVLARPNRTVLPPAPR